MNYGPPSAEVAYALSRLKAEEEFVSFLYDDATDKPVKAPTGNATIGYGCNVQAGWDEPFASDVLLLQVQRVETALKGFAWYQVCNPARRSVLLDVGFNDGTGGLESFHLMIAAISREDWPEVAAQCHVKNPKLAKRYAALAQILLTGVVA